jgi:hypothetical protein
MLKFSAKWEQLLPLGVKGLSKTILKKLYSSRNVFSIFFASGLSPYNDAFFTYHAKSTKI